MLEGRRLQSRRVIMAIAAVLILSGTIASLWPAPAARGAPACTIEWTGAGDGVSWLVPGNWSSGVLPGDSDHVCIQPATATSVTLDGAATVLTLTTSDTTAISVEGNGASLHLTADDVSTLPGDLVVTTGAEMRLDGTLEGGAVSVSNAAVLSLGGGAHRVATLRLGGGNAGQAIESTGGIDVGTFAWSRGALRGAGTTRVANAVEITGPLRKSIEGHTLVNQRETRWDGGEVVVRDGGRIVNDGGASFTMTSGAELHHFSGATGSFQNDGDFVANGGGTLPVEMAFANAGFVRVEAGTTLALERGGTGAGVYRTAGVLQLGGANEAEGHALAAGSTVEGAGTLRFDGGSHSVAGGFPFSGTLEVRGNRTSVTVDPAVTLGALDIAIGAATFRSEVTVTGDASVANNGDLVLEGADTQVGGTLTLGGGNAGQTIRTDGTLETRAFVWKRGVLQGAGTTRVAETLQITSPLRAGLEGHTLVNRGAARWDDGEIGVRDGGRVLNAAGASFVVEAGAEFDQFSGAVGAFENEGELVARGGGVIPFEIGFANGGTVIAEAGTTLSLSRGGTGSGVYRAGGTLVLGGANSGEGHLLEAGSTVEGSGTLRFDGGAHSVAGDFPFSGSFEVRGNRTAVTVAPEATLAVLDVELGAATFRSELRVTGDARVANNGDLVLDGAQTAIAGSLTLGGGNAGQTIRTDGAIETRAFVWTRGALQGAGSTRVAELLEISGPLPRQLEAHTLVNEGDGRWDSGAIRVRDGGRVLNAAGASFEVRPDAELHHFSGDVGAFVNRGELIASGSGTIPFETDFANEGTARVDAGTTLAAFAPGSYAQTAGKTIVDGTLLASVVTVDGGVLGGSGTVDGDLDVGAGAVAAGSSTGILVVTGDYTQSASGRLIAEIGGTTPGTGYDQLQVQGTAGLAGTLELVLVGGFQPDAADEFAVVTYGAVDGEFDTVDAPGPTTESYSADELVVNLQGRPAGDTTAPTWPSGALTATSVTDDSLRLTWSGATDDTAVDGYEVYQDGALIASPAATVSDYQVTGLSAATTYQFAVEAVDAAGNRSTDGPVTTVTTSGTTHVGHFGPDTGPSVETSPDWLSELPQAVIGAADAASEIVLIASTPGVAAHVIRVAPGVARTIDVDRDGTDDIEALLTLGSGATLPLPQLSVTRLGAAGAISDVEVLAIAPVPVPASDPAGDPARLVVGFRTTDRDGGPGGALPQREEIAFDMDVLGGLDHQISLVFNTTAPRSPLRLLAGHFVDSGRGTVAGPGLVSALLLDGVPSQVALDLSVEAQLAGGDPTGRVTFEWAHPTSEPRPTVVFEYLEREPDPGDRGTALDTRAVFEPMPARETIVLDLAPAGLTLTLAGSDSMDALAVEHSRDDGLEVRAALTDVPADVTVRLGDSLTITPGSSFGQTLDARVELQRPAGSILGGGALMNDLGYVLVGIDDAAAMTVTPVFDGDSMRLDLELLPRWNAPSGVTFVAADDPADLRLADLPDGRSWPAGPAVGWPTPAEDLLDVSLVDEPQGTTLAARVGRVNALSVDLEPARLSEAASVDMQRPPSFTVVLELAEAAPLAQGTAVDLVCTGQLRRGRSSLVFEPPATYGFDSDAGISFVRCDGDRGSRHVEFVAGAIPPTTTVALDPATAGAGALDITLADPSDPEPRIGRLTILLQDEVEPFADAALLGDPVVQAFIDAEGLPSLAVDWRNDAAGTAFELTSLAAEAPVEGLLVDLSSTIDAEPSHPERPADGFGQPRVTLSADHLFRLWEGAAGSRLSANLLSVRGAMLRADGESGVLALDLTTLAAHPLVADLVLPEGGHFVSDRSVNGACELDALAGGTSGFDVDPPLDVTLSSGSAAGAGTLECDFRVGRTSDDPYEVDLDLDGTGMPASFGLAVQPASAATLTTADQFGSLLVDLRDRSGDGLPGGDGLFAEPLRRVALRVGEVPAVRLDWGDAAARTDITVAPVNDGDVLGSAQLMLSTAVPQPAFASAPAHHSFSWRDEGNEGDEVTVRAGFVDIGAASFTADRTDETFGFELTTDGPHPLIASLDTEFGNALLPDLEVDASIEIRDVPATLAFTTDLVGSHRLDASADVGQIDITGTIDDVDDGDDEPSGDADNVDEDVIGFASRLSGIPERLTVLVQPTPRSELTHEAGSLDVDVSASGAVGSVQVELEDWREAGLFGQDVHRARLVAEGIPTSLFIDLAEFWAGTARVAGSPLDGVGERLALDGTSRISGGSGGRLGRLALELIHRVEGGDAPRLFGTPYGNAGIDLRGVPLAWSVELSNDPETGEASFSVAGSDGVVGRGPGDEIGEASFVLARDPGPHLGLELQPFEHAPSPVRDGFTASLDDAHFPAGPADRLDELFTLDYGLDTREVAAPTLLLGRDADQSLGHPAGTVVVGGTTIVPPTVTVPAEDHVVLDRDPEGLRFASGRISGVQAVSGSISDDGYEVVLQRIPSGGPEPLFFGMRVDRFAVGAKPETPEVSSNDWALDDEDKFAVDPGGTAAFALSVLKDDRAALEERNEGCESSCLALDESTLRISQGATGGGTAFVDEEGRVRYAPPNPEFMGQDAFAYEICFEDGRCYEVVVVVQVREHYHSDTMIQVAQLPAAFTVRVDGGTTFDFDGEDCREADPSGCTEEDRVWETDTVSYDGASDAGRIELYHGPAERPELSDPAAVHAVLFDAPRSLVAEIDDAGFPGTVALDGSDVSDGVATIAHRDPDSGRESRWVVGLESEDLTLGTTFRGILAPLIDVPADRPFANCDPLFGVGTCWLLLQVGVDIEAIGDATGGTGNGFFGYYERIPVGAAGGPAFVPRLTGKFSGVEVLAGKAELQIDPVWCIGGLGLKCPLDLEIAGFANRLPAGSVAFWNEEIDFCLPSHPGLCPVLPAAYDSGAPLTLLNTRPFAGNWDPYSAPPASGDADGIAPGIDGHLDAAGNFADESGTYSDRFTDEHLADGTTSGEITSRAGLVIEVEDLPETALPLGGVAVAAVAGAGHGEVRACGRSLDMTVNDLAQVRCGSLELGVIAGEVAVQLTEGTALFVPEGARVRVDESEGGDPIVVVDEDSTASARVVSAAGTTELPPGSSLGTPRSLTQGVLDDIRPLAGRSHRVDKAVRELERALDPPLWVDDLTLQSRRGHRVFSRLDHAVRELDAAIGKGDRDDDDEDRGRGRGRGGALDATGRAAVRDAIDRLVRASRLLAELEIAEAAAATPPGDDAGRFARSLERARAELAAGDEDRERDRLDRAIDHYRRAWERAEAAGRADDDDDEDDKDDKDEDEDDED